MCLWRSRSEISKIVSSPGTDCVDVSCGSHRSVVPYFFPFSISCLVLLFVRSAQGFFTVVPYLGFQTTPLAGVVLTSGPDRGLSKSAFVRST